MLYGAFFFLIFYGTNSDEKCYFVMPFIAPSTTVHDTHHVCVSE